MQQTRKSVDAVFTLTPGAMLAAIKFLLPIFAVEQNPTRRVLLEEAILKMARNPEKVGRR